MLSRICNTFGAKARSTTAKYVAAIGLALGLVILGATADHSPPDGPANASLTFSATASTPAEMQIFIDYGAGFSEEKSSRHIIAPGSPQPVMVSLPETACAVRIDPARGPAEVSIQGLSLNRQKENIFLHQLPRSSTGGTLESKGNSIRFISSSADPQITFFLPQNKFNALRYLRIAVLAFSLALVFVSAAVLTCAFAQDALLEKILCLQLGTVLALVMLVAARSELQRHPDEPSHNVAADYYATNWMTGSVNSPEMQATIIAPFGRSYLHLKDCVYFLAGKWGAVFSGRGIKNHILYRFFNVALLVSLFVALSLKKWDSLCFLGAACLTPQVWYIFSYFNGDGLSFAAAVAFCYHFTRRREDIVNYLSGRGPFGTSVVQFTALGALLVFARLHYLLVLPFVLGVAFLMVVEKKRGCSLLSTIGRFAFMLSLISAVYAIYYLKEEYVNGFARGPSIEAIAEQTRPPEADRRAIANGGANPHLFFLRDTGMGLREMAARYGWFRASYESFVAKFGLLDLGASGAFYWAHTLVCLVPLGVLLLCLWVRGSWWQRGIIFFAVIFCAGAVFQSLLYSWLENYQAQGRYIFAVIPIIATTVAVSRHIVPQRILLLWLMAVIAVNLYGFYAYAVKHLVF